MSNTPSEASTPWDNVTESYKLSNPHIAPADLARFLRFCAQHTDAYVHSKALTYPTTAAKVNWSGTFPGAEELDAYNRWWRTPARAHTRIGIFTTWSSSWVKNIHTWDRENWHVWAAVLVKKAKGYGKHLYIWDCDAFIPEDGFQDSDRAKYRVTPTQRTLIEALKKYGKLEGIWYGGGGGGQNKCVKETIDWVRALVHYPDSPFNAEDERFSGFKRFSKHQ